VRELGSVLAASVLLAGLVGLWVTSKRVEARRGEETRRLTERIEELSNRLEKTADTHRLGAGFVANSHLNQPSTAPSGLTAAGLGVSNATHSSQLDVADSSQADAGPPPALQWQEVQDNAEAQFIAEQYDRTWSAETAVRLRGNVSSRLPHDSRLRSLECRESLCRLETSHPDADQFREFQRESLRAPDFGWQGAMFFSPLKLESSGEVTAVTYLIRPGRPAAFATSSND